MTNIFDLINIDDLPPKMRNTIIDKNMVALEPYILLLFEEKEILMADEIMVALWRKFKIQSDRPKVMARLKNLYNSDKISDLGNRVFRKR